MTLSRLGIPVVGLVSHRRQHELPRWNIGSMGSRLLHCSPSVSSGAYCWDDGPFHKAIRTDRKRRILESPRSLKTITITIITPSSPNELTQLTTGRHENCNCLRRKVNFCAPAQVYFVPIKSGKGIVWRQLSILING